MKYEEPHSGVWCVEFILPNNKRNVQVFDDYAEAALFMDDIEDAGAYQGRVVVDVTLWEM